MLRLKLSVFLSLIVLVTLAAMIGWRWVRPYRLPAVPSNLTAQQAGLDFTLERQIVRGADQTNLSYTTLKAQTTSTNTQENETAIIALKAALNSEPENLVYGNLLRTTLVRLGRTSELVDFFSGLKSSSAKSQLQKAIAIVDGLQNPDLASASLGQMSLRSMNELDLILDQNPYYWLARLSRGLNNLYWPIGLRRNDKAVADLGYAVAIAEAIPTEKGPFLAMAYAGYGDALVKGGAVSEGMRIWQRGLERFPNSPDLRRRSAVGVQGATALVERERGIDTFTRPEPTMTDLSSIWDSAD